MAPRKLARLAPVAAAIVAGVAVAAVSQGNSTSKTAVVQPPPAVLQLQANLVRVVQALTPSVVQIETEQGLGSGVVFDAAGHIVTNAHVVGSAKSFTVSTSNGKRYKATLRGTFPPDDIAVITVSGAKLRPATFANSSNLRRGDFAIAIGNPLGLSSSVTQGIVSAFRTGVPEGTGAVLRLVIQTSAPINPGNSGGALADIRGRVIGIPTLGVSDPQMGGAAQGIGFAIPSNVARDLASQIVKHGKVVNSHRAYLGVTVGDTNGSGVFVNSVTPGGPAAKAGIKEGDVITAINGRPTPTVDALGVTLAVLNPGQKVKVALEHQDGGKATVEVTLGEYPGG
jgi:S1-C subfamily serine protease